MSKKSNKKRDPPFWLIGTVFLIGSIVAALFVGYIIPYDYVPAHVPCEENGMHWAGQVNHNMTRCEDNYGNIRWIQR